MPNLGLEKVIEWKHRLCVEAAAIALPSSPQNAQKDALL